MRRHKPLFAMLLVAILAEAVAGCASLGKCGTDVCRADRNITAQVQSLLKDYPALGPPNLVRVQTGNRVVYLTGQVNTDRERELAESVARAAVGVEQVVNSIAVSNVGL